MASQSRESRAVDTQATEASQEAPSHLNGDTRKCVQITANTTSFTVRADAPGVAVLTETFLPDDFQATLNGTRVPYFRVNHAFKGVVIPSAGVWHVKVEYRPKYWRLSLAGCGGGIAVLAALALAGRRWRHTSNIR